MSRRLLFAQLAVVSVCVLLLRLRWPSFDAFVLAIDHGSVPLADFVFHYYPTARDSIRAGAPAGGFFYPAGFAVLLAPLGLVPLAIAKTIWGVVLGGSVLWMATWLAAAATPKQPALSLLGTALVVTSVPVLHDLKWGQVSVLIVAAAATAFVLRARGGRHRPAALLGIAAAIKGYPLVFVGWFFLRLRREWKFFLGAALACAITLVVLPAIVMGPTHAMDFQRIATQSVLGATDGVLYDFNSQFAPAVLARYHGGWGAAGHAITHAGELGAAAMLAVIGALLLVVVRTRAPRIAERRELWAFVLVASTVPFWLKTSWTHYFVHLPLAQLLLVSALVERRRARDIAALVVLVAPSIYLSSVLGLYAEDGWWAYANSGAPFFANMLVLLAATLVVVDAHVLEDPSDRIAAAERSRDAHEVDGRIDRDQPVHGQGSRAVVVDHVPPMHSE